MMSFSDRDFTRHDGVLIAEAAELGFRAGHPMPREFRVLFRGGMALTFAFSHRDMNGADVAGWNYLLVGSHATTIRGVLIVND
jgi:hypothetical protein